MCCQEVCVLSLNADVIPINKGILFFAGRLRKFVAQDATLRVMGKPLQGEVRPTVRPHMLCQQLYTIESM